MAKKAAEATVAAVETKEAEKKPNFKAIITESLKKTKREGVEELLNYMDEIGFYKAPCSTRYHLAEEGGLAEHSVNVLNSAEKISVALYGAKNITEEIRSSIIIVALLHDLGKCGDYGKPMYVDKVLKSGKKGVQPYDTNKDLTGVPHAIRSVKLATLFIDLTEDEEWAILTHDGLYDFMKYQIPGHETPLSLILHWADMWASHVLEIADDAESEGE